jgi:hypothetical protein
VSGGTKHGLKIQIQRVMYQRIDGFVEIYPYVIVVKNFYELDLEIFAHPLVVRSGIIGTGIFLILPTYPNIDEPSGNYKVAIRQIQQRSC